MDDNTKRQLGELNREFYRQYASVFAETRSKPQPGFYELEKYLRPAGGRVLDVGCGEGRLGRFLLDRGRIDAYDGIDGSKTLIELARNRLSGRFWNRDLMDENALSGTGVYDVVACLAVLHHIPGRDNRLRLLSDMARHLKPGGRLLISNWQFLTSDRQSRKVVDWREVGLQPAMLEENDYLLTWSRGGRGLRYVCFIDEAEIVALSHEAGLDVVATFRSDGREGDLNLYSVHELGRNGR